MTKPAPKIYVLARVDGDMAHLVFEDETGPYEFTTVEDGIQWLKDADEDGVVVTVSARVTHESRFKVELWK